MNLLSNRLIILIIIIIIMMMMMMMIALLAFFKQIGSSMLINIGSYANYNSQLCPPFVRSRRISRPASIYPVTLASNKKTASSPSRVRTLVYL